MCGMDERPPMLNDRRFWLVDDAFGTCPEAFAAAEQLVQGHQSMDPIEPLSVIGDFVIPPLESPASRDFQTLHVDFGLPLDPKIAQDIARFTALYIGLGDVGITATTRLVPLVPLLAQRRWPERGELIARFAAYGWTHGARDDRRGYSEGSFARIIDAASTNPPLLASVKTEPDFLCGTEFGTSGAELAFFRQHGLDVEDVVIDIVLRPGQLLVFDNLAFAHGRRGRRQPGELHQRMFGHHQMSVAGQRNVREQVLSAFDAPSTTQATSGSLVSIP
jgi:hypothetical protein